MKRVPSPYRVGFLRTSRNLYDRYVDSVKPWARTLWYEWLDVRPGFQIVDVGCGTGHFTRFLARALKGQGHVIGLDVRPALLATAEKETKREKMAELVEFRLGDATSLPLATDPADLVACKTVLMHLKDPLKAVREMYRVAKRGGLVAAVETDFRMRCYHSPRGEDRNKVAQKFSEAWVKGIATLEGKDYTIGSKLPELFAKTGLVYIKADLDADPWLNCDPRRPLKDKLVELRTSLEGLRNFDDTRKCLEAGGMSKREIESYRKQSIDAGMRLIGDRESLLCDTTFYGACWFIVTGKKPMSSKG